MDFFLFDFLHSFSGQSEFFDGLFVFLAKYLPYILVLMALFFIFRLKPVKNKIYILIFVVLSIILSRGIITPILRFFYDRPRPSETLSFEPLFYDLNRSFPSGHAAFFFVLAFALLYFNRQWGFWFLIFAFLNSLSRIIVGVHWPSDILGGVAVAFIAFFAIKSLIGRQRPA